MKTLTFEKDARTQLKELLETYVELRCGIEDEVTKINNAISILNQSIETANININEINDLTERKNLDFTVDEIKPVSELHVDITETDFFS